MEGATGFRKRGVVQLLLILVGQSVGFAGFMLTSLFRDNVLPDNWIPVAAVWYGLGVVLWAGTRIAVPYTDPVILPITLALTGLGLATLHRMDLDSGDTPMLTNQFLAVVVSVVALLVIVFLIKDPRRLRGYPYVLSLVGVLLLLLPLIPGLGDEIYGSRIWISVAGFSFQPAEIAKIVLAASFAAYLANNREVLSLAGRRFIGLDWPRMRDLGPVAVMWAVSLAIMVFENDLGTSLLFFGLFVAMIYIATGKFSWVVIGLLMFGLGGLAVIRYAGHVQRRIDFWLHPFDFPDDATQIIQAQFGLSHGGLFGSGWGLGQPDLIIFASSDMISAAVGEEIGIVGLMAVIALYALLVFRGIKAALVATDPFVKLFTAGLSFVFLLQTFAIIGGVTRLLPLTGLTTPFLSQGGSSMIANWILIAGLVVVSHQARRPQAEVGETGAEGVTDLEGEATQVLSAKVLAQIGTGAIHPVQAIDAEQVKLDSHGTVVVAGLSGDVAREPVWPLAPQPGPPVDITLFAPPGALPPAVLEPSPGGREPSPGGREPSPVAAVAPELADTVRRGSVPPAGTVPEQPGTVPGQSGTVPEQPGTVPGQPGTVPERPVSDSVRMLAYMPPPSLPPAGPPGPPGVTTAGPPGVPPPVPPAGPATPEDHWADDTIERGSD